MKFSMKQLLAASALVGALAVSTGHAATTVSFTSPLDGSVAPVGTAISPTGVASATGGSGQTLDLILVLDSSGSMTSSATAGGTTQSRQLWQRQFATELVNNLPVGSTRVGVVEFDSDANLVRTLSPLTTDLALVVAAINSVDASGGTNIPSGQIAAYNEFVANGALADPNVLSAMVIFSDGSSTGDPGATADLHASLGVDNISSVALPGAFLPTMQDIADGVDDILGTADDHGVFIDGTNLDALIGAFTGGGTFVGIQQVDITLPDGTLLADIPIDAFGNFTVPVPYNIQAGANTWTALATATDGSTASDTVTVFGRDGGGQTDVPVPAPLLLLAAGMLAMARTRGRA